MAGNLTPWETDQIKTIDNLIQKCKLRYCAFESEHRVLNPATPQDVETLKESVPERLRYFAADLYSALDFLCYVSYCHFKNDGNPSNSAEARNVKFPHTKKLRKLIDVDGQELVSIRGQEVRGERGKFVWNNFRTMFTCFQPDEFGPQDASTQQRYDRFEEIILNCQVITNIDEDGQPLQQQDQMEEATAFNTLHFLRNTNIHRNLVDNTVHNGWLYVNLLDGSHEFVPQQIPDRENDPRNWQSIEVGQPGCWITIPSFISSRMENGDMLKRLLIVTQNILDFVTNARDELLKIAFPSVYGTDGGIAEFDRHAVRYGLEDGVHIGRPPNQRDYSWNDFYEKCHVMRTSVFWAV